jgi:hypothetical protein
VCCADTGSNISETTSLPDKISDFSFSSLYVPAQIIFKSFFSVLLILIYFTVIFSKQWRKGKTYFLHATGKVRREGTFN